MDTLTKNQLIRYLRHVCGKTDEEVVAHVVTEKIQRLVPFAGQGRPSRPCPYASSALVYQSLKKDGPSTFWLENETKLRDISFTDVYYLYHHLKANDSSDSEHETDGEWFR